MTIPLEAETSPCVCLSLSQVPSLQLLNIGSFEWTASCIRELLCSCCLFGCSLTQAGAVWFDNLKLWERLVKINWASTKKTRAGFRALVLWFWAVQPAEGQGCGSRTSELCSVPAVLAALYHRCQGEGRLQQPVEAKQWRLPGKLATQSS